MNGIDALATIIILSIVGEVLIEALKPALAPIQAKLPESIDLYLYLSMVFGLVLAFNWSANVFVVIGLGEGSIALLGTIATGLILGRGSNFVHDVISRLGAGKPA